MQRADRALDRWLPSISLGREASAAARRLRSGASIVLRAIRKVAAWRLRLAPGALTPNELETWTGVPCLGSIPMAQAGSTERNPSLAVVESDDLALTAAFRHAHASLFRACPQAQVVALASALPGDGKTTCAVALARQSALKGHRTVLVDCDLRRRSASAELDRPSAVGLLEVIAGDATLDEALARDGFTPLRILPVADDIDRISRAVVGDVFGAPATAQVMALLRAQFDYVFLDAPPVLGIADARRVARLADATLLVSRWRRTPRDLIDNAVALLRSTGTPVAGAVLTRAPARAQGRSAGIQLAAGVSP